MGCLGVHYALDEETVDALKFQPSDAARLEYLTEEIEENYFGAQEAWIAESDKAWDVIHRTLTDGEIDWDNGTFPLCHVIMGGERIYELHDYIMTLKTPSEVKEIAEALRSLTDDEFRQRHFRVDSTDLLLPDKEEDYEYTWYWFQRVRDLYFRAASANRYVLFTASQ